MLWKIRGLLSWKMMRIGHIASLRGMTCEIFIAKWMEEKEKFHNQLKDNFRGLVSQYKSGQQEIFELSVGAYTKHYEQAFRELFADTGYQATVGATEKLGTGNKRCKKLYVTLPPCHN